MKKITFILLASLASLSPLKPRDQLPDLEKSIQRCSACQALLTAQEIIQSQEDELFLCAECKRQKGKGDEALAGPTVGPPEFYEEGGFQHHLKVVRRSDYLRGRENPAMRYSCVQNSINSFFDRRNMISVITKSGYQLVTKKHWEPGLYFVRGPHAKKYKIKIFPLIEGEEGKEEPMQVEEVIPLPINKFLITTPPKEDETASFYLYDPHEDSLKELATGDLADVMGQCDQAVEELKKEHRRAQQRKAARSMKKEKRDRILKDFFDELLAKSKEQPKGKEE